MSAGWEDEPVLGWVRHAQILVAQETGIDVTPDAIEIDLDGRTTIDTGVSTVTVWRGSEGLWCGSVVGPHNPFVYRGSRMEALLAACSLHEKCLGGAMACKRCHQPVELDGKPGDTDRVRRVCGCENGPTHTDRPWVEDLIANQQKGKN